MPGAHGEASPSTGAGRGPSSRPIAPRASGVYALPRVNAPPPAGQHQTRTLRRMNPRRLLLPGLVSAALAVACRTPTGAPLPPRTVCQNRAPGIGPTDVLTVVVFNENALSGEFRVAEDGSVTFPYLGRVEVIGMQPAEVADALRRGLGEQTADNPTGRNVLTHPNVRVEIKEANSRRISVSGQVQHPNQYAFTRCLTVTQAIALAGGFTALAEKNQVRVTRVGRNGERRVFVLRVEDILEGRRDDFDIEPGDVIYVPESVT